MDRGTLRARGAPTIMNLATFYKKMLVSYKCIFSEKVVVLIMFSTSFVLVWVLSLFSAWFVTYLRPILINESYLLIIVASNDGCFIRTSLPNVDCVRALISTKQLNFEHKV